MKPPIVPHQGRGIDTVNFRNVKESESVDISGSRPMKNGAGGGGGAGGGAGAGAGAGVPLDSGLATPGAETPDPFEEFNSVTLHHEEEWNQGGRS